MNILFRVDAGGLVGLGHFYRSMNLAHQLKRRGHEVFISHLNSTFWSSADNKGSALKFFELDTIHSEVQTLEIIYKNQIQVYYVDGIIDFKKDFILAVKKNAKVIFYQNLSDSRQFADIFILPSIHHDTDFFTPFDKNSRIYSGLQYFMYNPILHTVERKINIKKDVSDIAIAAGGSDPTNSLKLIYNYVTELKYNNIEFIFYIGKDYVHKNSIPKKLPSNIHFAPFNHNEIIKNDILITAFGVSTYEFLYLGIPVISYGHQEGNAIAAIQLATKTDSLISLDEIHNLPYRKFEDTLKTAFNYYRRKKLTDNAKKLLDLKGTERVINIIENIK